MISFVSLEYTVMSVSHPLMPDCRVILSRIMRKQSFPVVVRLGLVSVFQLPDRGIIGHGNGIHRKLVDFLLHLLVKKPKLVQVVFFHFVLNDMNGRLIGNGKQEHHGDQYA